MCREWLVREDGALAYRLQNAEIQEHYSNNKHRNAQVREDFPCAKDEQLREQRLAEQAAAVYQQMLAEQEELDNKLAQELGMKYSCINLYYFYPLVLLLKIIFICLFITDVILYVISGKIRKRRKSKKESH